MPRRENRSRPRPEGNTRRAAESRRTAVLQAVVQEHVLHGEPVSSTRAAKLSRLGLSPASIRNVMAELEQRGLLFQPHTSAGRVPTVAGYRQFVRSLLDRDAQLGPAETRRIDQALASSGGDVSGLLGEASRQLSVGSQQLGIVLAPEIRRVVVDRLEFVPLDRNRLAAILVGRSGIVHHRLLRVDEPFEPRELERISRYVSEHYGGRTLPEMRTELIRRMGEERQTLDDLRAKSFELCAMAVRLESDGAELFVEGAANLLESPELADIDVLRALLQVLERKQKLVDLLGRLIDQQGVRVMIGDENALSGLAPCSVVASTYRCGESARGTVGIVGPIRMAYGRVIPLVDYLARALSDHLTPPED